MKKSILLVTLLAVLSLAALSQEETTVKVGGFVAYEAYYDTYQSVVSRDGELYLYPRMADLDINGVDLNKSGTLNMLSLISRFNIKAGGPEILGAKSSALIEADFFGTAQNYVRLLRLRHAYVKLNWEKAEFLAGHAFHPAFVTACFPGVLTYAVAVPFHPLNRSNQVRLTLHPTEDLSLLGALLVHSYHRSSGPVNAQRNSGIPDMQFQVQLTPGRLLLGATAGYKVLKPRLETAGGAKTTETVGSFNLQGFLKYSTESFSLKAMATFGENLTNFVSIGGYGAAQDPLMVDDYNYTNMRTATMWTDLSFGQNPKVGVFGGYAKNMGGNGDYYSLGYGRGENLVYTYRLSPRLTYAVKNLTLGLEVLYQAAVYGENFDTSYRAETLADPTANARILTRVKYSF